MVNKGVITIRYNNTLHKEALKFSENNRKEDGGLNIKSDRTDGGGIYIGYISERLVADTFGWSKENSEDYDLVTPSKQKVEVKCRECNQQIAPLEHYECGVYAYYKQKCDYYVFTRINPAMQICWILGMISRDDFYKKSRKINAGEVDPSNGRKFNDDIYNMNIGDLQWPKKIRKKAKFTKFGR